MELYSTILFSIIREWRMLDKFFRLFNKLVIVLMLPFVLIEGAGGIFNKDNTGLTPSESYYNDIHIRSIVLDTANAIWAVSPNQIISIKNFNPKIHVTAPKYNMQPYFIQTNQINGIIVDKFNNKVIHSYLTSFNDDETEFIVFNDADSLILKTNNVLKDQNHCAASDTSGDLWFGQTSGLYHVYDTTKWGAVEKKYKLYYMNQLDTSLLGNSPVKSLTIDSKNVKWIGAEKYGLIRYDGVSGSTLDTSDGLPSNNISHIATDSENNGWLICDRKVVRIVGDLVDTIYSDTSWGTLKNIFVDRSDAVWLSTSRGAVRFSGSVWRIYTTDDGLLSGHGTYQGGGIRGITEDNDGNYWFGTNGAGIVWSDLKYDAAFIPSFDYIEDADTIGKVLGFLAAGEITPVVNSKNTFTKISGSNKLTINGDTLELSGTIDPTDDTLSITVEATANGLYDTITVALPVRHWTMSGDSASYLKIEIPEEDVKQLIPSNVDVRVLVRLTPVNGFSSTTTLSSSLGTLSKTEWVVPPEGEVIYLFIDADSLVEGDNIIKIEGVNSGIILGNALCTLTVGSALDMSNLTIAKDSIGQVGVFTINFNDKGKEYFGSEDIEVIRYSSDYVLTLGTKSATYNGFSCLIKDIETGDTLCKKTFRGEYGNSEHFNIVLDHGRKYRVTTYGYNNLSVRYSGVGIKNRSGDAILPFSYADDYVKANLVYYDSTEINVIGTELGRDTINASQSNDYSITALKPINSETILYRSLSSSKFVFAPTIRVTLPYEFKTLFNSLNYLGGGEVDTVTGDIWVYDEDKKVIESFIDSIWDTSSVSGIINTMAIAPDGAVWVGTTGGAYAYDGSIWNHYTDLSNLDVTKFRFLAEGTVYAYNGVWDQFNSPFWTKAIDSTTVPEEVGKRSVKIYPGYSEIENRYNFSSRKVMQYVLGENITAITIDDSDDEIVSDNSNNSITAYPNPVSVTEKYVSIHFPNSIKGTVNVSILDLMGNLLDAQEGYINNNATIKWNLKNQAGIKVASGTYIAVIKVKSPEGEMNTAQLMFGVKE